MSIDILVVLQNAYRAGADGSKAEQRWLKNIWQDGGTGWNSHTGRRLSNILPDGYGVLVVNASNNVGGDPSSVFEADLDWIDKVIRHTAPYVIVGCGRVAQKALDKLGCDYIESPHPAWRALSKEKEQFVRAKILQRLTGGSSSG